MRLLDSRATKIVVATALILIAPSAGLAQVPGRPAIAATPQFAFYSDFATNLNDALIAAGVARRANEAELFRSGSEKPCFDQLPASERAAWDRVTSRTPCTSS